MIQKFLVRAARKLILPRLPIQNRLPLRYRTSLLLNECENELRYLSTVIASGETAIDVGANSGLYSYKLSKQFQKVLAFEINDDLTQELSAYNPGNIQIINQGLSSRSDRAVLYIPVLEGRPLTGWASLQPGNCPNAQEHVEKSVEICQLDTFQLQSVSFIKIDVEGHEVEVLKGACETIKRHRPHLMIEIKEENLECVSKFFEVLSYRMCQLQDLINVPGSKENYFLIPN